jgi:hypothetical protein
LRRQEEALAEKRREREAKSRQARRAKQLSRRLTERSAQTLQTRRRKVGTLMRSRQIASVPLQAEDLQLPN